MCMCWLLRQNVGGALVGGIFCFSRPQKAVFMTSDNGQQHPITYSCMPVGNTIPNGWKRVAGGGFDIKFLNFTLICPVIHCCHWSRPQGAWKLTHLNCGTWKMLTSGSGHSIQQYNFITRCQPWCQHHNADAYKVPRTPLHPILWSKVTQGKWQHIHY